MNCQKLSLEASIHAAQNERLPLRVIVQVLFFEQLRLRTSIAGWFFVSESLDNSQNTSRNLVLARTDATHQDNADHGNTVAAVDGMRDRVSELEKECSTMKQDLEKLATTKGVWNGFFRKFALRRKSKSTDEKLSKVPNVNVKPANITNVEISEKPTAPLLTSKERCDEDKHCE